MTSAGLRPTPVSEPVSTRRIYGTMQTLHVLAVSTCFGQQCGGLTVRAGWCWPNQVTPPATDVLITCARTAGCPTRGLAVWGWALGHHLPGGVTVNDCYESRRRRELLSRLATLK